MNRRRVRRRRRAAVAAGLLPRHHPAGFLSALSSSSRRLRAALPAVRATFGDTVSRFYAVAGNALGSASTLALSSAREWRANVARYCGWCLEFGASGTVRVLAGLRTLRMWLRLLIAKGWSAANREIELPEAKLRPYLQAAAGLFALVAVSIAIFTAVHTLRGKSESETPPYAALRDHHPPLALVADIGPARDAEAEFVNLPFGPEDEPEPPERHMLAEAVDIDAQNWFAHSFVVEDDPIASNDVAEADEEDLETAMAALLPRAMPRPDTPQRPAVTGIPIRPEPPFGTAPAQPAWLANAVEPRQRGNGPMIAIVIDDAGVVQHRTRRASELPAPLTIAFIPYSNNLEAQSRYARAQGHELLLHMPMEPGSAAIDPGHNALLTTLGHDEVMRRFRWALERFDGYVGVNNHMGSKFMARPDFVRPVLEEINARGLLFLDSRTDHHTVGTKLARDIGMPHATRNVFLDNDLDEDKIAAQLAQLEKLARKRGHAIAIGHPHDVTVDVLARWIPEAKRKGFRLVPVSAIVKKEYETQLASAAGRGESDGFLGGAQ